MVMAQSPFICSKKTAKRFYVLARIDCGQGIFGMLN
jgi:hypothetical protein